MEARNYALLLHRRADLITGRLAEPFGEDGAADGGHDFAVCVEERAKSEVCSPKGKSLFLPQPSCGSWRPACMRAVLGISDIPREVPRRVGPHLLSATPTAFGRASFKLG